MIRIKSHNKAIDRKSIWLKRIPTRIFLYEIKNKLNLYKQLNKRSQH